MTQTAATQEAARVELEQRELAAKAKAEAKAKARGNKKKTTPVKAGQDKGG